VLEEFKVSAEGHAQNLQNCVLSIKHKTDHVRNELDTVQVLFEKIRVTDKSKSKSRPRDEKYDNTASSYSRTRYNPSGSKYQPSTFDNKIEKYKKTAEDRKSQNRSGSSYVAGHDSRSNGQLKDRVRQLEVGFNNICIAFQSREEEFEVLKEVIEDNENDQFGFIYQTEEAFRIMQDMSGDDSKVYINKVNQVQLQGRRTTPQDNSGSYYKDSSMKYPKRDFSPESASFDAIKMQDLQRTNELLLKELRTANDKYFSERLESKKLKEELSNLKKEVNLLKRQKSSTRTTAVKHNLNDVSKDNEGLRKRIEGLEQECNALTYYRETMLSNSNNAFSLDNFDPDIRRANQESDLLRNKLESTTIHIKRFMLGMKRLQRGIKNKDPNNKTLKMEFERAKKELEDWCRGLKDEFPNNRSQSRSKERIHSPIGTYSQSRIYSPNMATPGTTTPPKGKTSKSQSRIKKPTKDRLANAAGTQHVSNAFASLIKDPNREEFDASGEISRDDIRHLNFDTKDAVNMFNSGDRSVDPKTGDLSRTTFGIKNAKGGKQEASNISGVDYQSLKNTLMQMVDSKENELKHRLNDITDDLNKKTTSLSNMKHTLVSKLKELENALAETNKEYQRSLDAEALLSSSHEERGQSQVSELMEVNKALDNDLVEARTSLDLKTRETQDLHLELKKAKRDLTKTQKELEQTLAKEKSGALENEVKKFEVTELEKFKEKQAKSIIELQEKLTKQTEQHTSQKKKDSKDVENKLFKLQELESRQIKNILEITEKLKQKDKELALKTSAIEDYKTQIKQNAEEIKELKTQNKALSISQIKPTFDEFEYDTFADDPEDEQSNEIQQKRNEIKELLKSNPTKATEELYKLWTDTYREFRIVKKNNSILEDKYEELKLDGDEMKQDERETVEKMLLYDVKIRELEKVNGELNRMVESKESFEDNQKKKESEVIEKLNQDYEKLTKKFNDTSDLHRNLSLKEKKLENASKELLTEIDEYKRKAFNAESELDAKTQQSENDISRLEIQISQVKDEKNELIKEYDLLKQQLDEADHNIKKRQEELDAKTQQSENDISGLKIQISQVEDERNELLKDYDSLKQQLDEADHKVEKKQEELDAKTQQSENDISGLEIQIGQVEDEKNELIKEYDLLKQQLDEAEHKVKKKQEELDAKTQQSENDISRLEIQISQVEDEKNELIKKYDLLKQQLDEADHKVKKKQEELDAKIKNY
jgi:hypothetical protein